MLSACLFFCLVSIVASKSIDMRVNWREFVSRSDPLWSFHADDPQSMPTMWFDSPFHGNGNLGMLVLAEKVTRNGEEKYILRFDLGRADVWDVRMQGSPYAHGDRYSHSLLITDSQVDRCRLETGHFELETAGIILNGTMRINLFDANVTGTLITTKGSVRFTTLTFSSEHLFLIDLEPEDGETELSIRYVAEQGVCNGRYQPEDYVKNPEPECSTVATSMREYNVCQHRLLERGDYAEAYVIDSTASRLRVFASIDIAIPANRLRDMSAKEGSVAMLERILSRGLDQLLKEHQAFWHAYYQQSFLSIPDMKWEGFYWIQVGPARRCDP